MSKPIQAAVIILFVLLVGSAGIAAYFILQNQKLNQDNQALQTQLQDFQKKETDLLTKAKKLEKDQQELNDKIKQKEKDRDQAQLAYDGLKAKADELNAQIAAANQDRDDYKGRVETIRKERDDLMEKLKNQKEKIVEKPVEKIVEKIVYRDRPASGEDADKADDATAQAAADQQMAEAASKGDQYWAGVLKEKEVLKLDLQKAQAELDQSALQVVELKKQNSDIQMELKNLTDIKEDLEKKLAKDKQDLETQIANEKKEYERKIKYSEDLANSLSMEVARAHTDQKDSVDRAEKYRQEMLGLQDQIKQLSATKLALERTIAQINQDKVSMQKRLDQTEGAIQGRIDEIWKIKQRLDQKISQLPTASDVQSKQARAAEVELTPIVVNPSAASSAVNEPVKEQPVQKKNVKNNAVSALAGSAGAVAGKGQGTIISINEPNNFVIVDLGENDGSEVGRKMTAFRDNNPVGDLEVIQVRKDISAADIMGSTGALRVGDTVRYN